MKGSANKGQMSVLAHREGTGRTRCRQEGLDDGEVDRRSGDVVPEYFLRELKDEVVEIGAGKVGREVRLDELNDDGRRRRVRGSEDGRPGRGPRRRCGFGRAKVSNEEGEGGN